MGILRSDRVSGLGGANAIKGSVKFTSGGALDIDLDGETIGTSNFTIEAWVYWFGGDSHQITGSSSNNFNFYIADDDGDLKFYNGSSTYDFDASPVTPNEWTHVALVREGTSTNQTKVYVNGVNTNNITLNTSFSFDRLLSGINYLGGSRGYGDGYTSNLRFTLDTVYTSAFTPPNNELTVLDNTIVLCCQSPGNILQEATGKTIVPFKHGVTQSDAVASHFAPDKGEDHGTTFTDNTKFDTLSYMVPPGGTTAESNRGRGILFGGQSPGADSTIQYVQIQSQGNAIKFGNLSDNKSAVGAVASSTRAVSAGGYIAANTNVIEYVTIATTSKATDFGDLAEPKHWVQGGGNQTRGIFAGGNADSPVGHTNTIEYITIATAGNASNFGDIARKPSTSSGSAMNSSTRAVFGGGSDPSAALYNTLEYVTIATTGDATDFGDMTDNKARYGGCSSSTRGIIGCGENPGISNVITYITIATTGNSVDFGDATQAREDVAAVSNSIRGVFVGGQTPNNVNTMDYINIASAGNAQDFGDQTILADHVSGCSDSHGGLS